MATVLPLASNCARCLPHVQAVMPLAGSVGAGDRRVSLRRSVLRASNNKPSKL